MTESVVSSSGLAMPNGKKALNFSVKSWFVIALAGQWAFAFYILTIYLLTAIFGLNVTDFSPAPNLKSANDTVYWIYFGHTVPAIYLSLFGLFQLVPSIRAKYKSFHRWNGRIFLILGMTGALTGLFLQWSKGLETNTLASLGISVNGLLILVAGYFTWHYAVNKQITRHKRWAIHAFILVNGVWTFRLYLMGWYMVNQGPNGNTPNIDGPMDIFLSFACYLLPMAIAEMYFWIVKQRSNNKIWLGTLIMTTGAVISLIGVVAAVMVMWLPRIEKVLGAIY